MSQALRLRKGNEDKQRSNQNVREEVQKTKEEQIAPLLSFKNIFPLD